MVISNFKSLDCVLFTIGFSEQIKIQPRINAKGRFKFTKMSRVSTERFFFRGTCVATQVTYQDKQDEEMCILSTKVANTYKSTHSFYETFSLRISLRKAYQMHSHLKATQNNHFRIFFKSTSFCSCSLCDSQNLPFSSSKLHLSPP